MRWKGILAPRSYALPKIAVTERADCLPPPAARAMRPYVLTRPAGIERAIFTTLSLKVVISERRYSSGRDFPLHLKKLRPLPHRRSFWQIQRGGGSKYSGLRSFHFYH